MKKISLLIILLLVSIAAAEPNQLSEIQRLNAEIVQLKTKIDAHEKTIRRAEKAVENLKGQISQLKKDNRRLLVLCRKNNIETAIPTLTKQSNFNNVSNLDGFAKKFTPPLEIGQVAYLGGDNTLRVIQIIDQQNVIVDFVLTYFRDAYVNGFEFRNLAGEPMGPIIGPSYNRTVWLKGFDTAGLVDDSVIKTDKPLKVTGIKTYGTYGTITIFLIEPYTTNPHTADPNESEG